MKGLVGKHLQPYNQLGGESAQLPLNLEGWPKQYTKNISCQT